MKSRFWSHLFDIAPHEWSRVAYSFSLELFLMMAHVLGHAILIAAVAEQFGATALPYLWIGAALLTVTATALLLPLLNRLEKRTLIYSLGAGAALLLGWAFLSLELGATPWAFLILALLGMSALGAVLHIVVQMTVESLFTPLEAERVFPFISSSALLGGFLGGGLITILTGSYYHWGIEELTAVWAIMMLGPVLVTFIYQIGTLYVPHLKISRREIIREGFVTELREGAKWMKDIPFVKTLAGVVFLQFVIIQLLEFQYAVALAAGAEGHGESHLIHGLGFYGAVFSGTGLLLQMVLAKKSVRALGIVRTMMLNPILALAPMVAMAVKLAVPTAVMAKLVYQSSGVVSKNAYLASFYAISEHARERVKPLIEGWIVPAGAVAGTLLLIVLGRVFPGASGDVSGAMTTAISVILVLLTITVLTRMWFLRDHYTQLSVKNLRRVDDHEKHNMVEILAQNGHRNGFLHLEKALLIHRNKPGLRIKILEALGHLGAWSTLPVILDHLYDNDPGVKKAAIDALKEFKGLTDHFEDRIFARHRVLSVLENIFWSEGSRGMKQDIIRVLANLDQNEVAPFLIRILNETKDAELLAETIVVMASFQDPSIAHYVRKFLYHEDPRLRARAIVALWQFPGYRSSFLLAPQIKMLASQDRQTRMEAIWMLGEIRNKAEMRKLYRYLLDEDEEIAFQAAVALAKMGEAEGGERLLSSLWRDRERVINYQSYTGAIHPKLGKRVQKSVRHELARRVSDLLGCCEYDLTRLTEEETRELEGWYVCLGEKGEAERLRQMAGGE